MDDSVISKNGATCWHLDKIPFSEDVAKKAQVELNERPEIIDKSIKELRNMINEVGDFSTFTDDDYLLRYLRARKFDCQRAYKLLRNYHLSVIKYPAIFGDIRPSAIKDYLYCNVFTVLPYRDPEGRVIGVVRLGEIHPERTPFNIAARIAGISLETLIQHPVTQVNGLVTILDLRGITIRFFTYVTTPSNLRMALSLFQDCFPGRPKRHHVVFGYNFARLAYEAVKFFLNEKMRKRVVFHGDDMKSLHEYIPPEILPKEYGGTLDLDRSLWPEKLLSMETYLADLFKEVEKNIQSHGTFCK